MTTLVEVLENKGEITDDGRYCGQELGRRTPEIRPEMRPEIMRCKA
jgi:hypothetical protein